jgi:gliding motility-associated-like protein
MKNWKFYILVILLSSFASRTFATHLRAGEITAKRISMNSLTYRITLTTYTDEINGKNANDTENSVNFYFGFTTTNVVNIVVPRTKSRLISPSTKCNVYETTFTFPSPGRYTISCGIVNRNENTINLPAESSSISFFVQSTLIINGNIGQNSTPILLNIPVDSAAIGNRFIHNPGAFDEDGDSLSYKLSTPMRDKGKETGIGEFITGYIDPSTIGEKSPILNELEDGPATFRIDPRTGDLIWDAPQKKGQYNIAFIVEEWRKAPDGRYIKIGEVTRDMQIIVVESNNKRPILTVPPDVCIEAGKSTEFSVSATDRDNNLLSISSTSGVYNKDANGLPITFIKPLVATFSSKSSIPPVTGIFKWTTNCDHVREQAYDVLFKVEDNPGRFITQLVDIKTVKVKVLPPRPSSLLARDTGGGVRITWQAYNKCSFNGKILVYRKEGCSGLNPGECIQGMPADWSYQKIGTVNLNDTLFIDNNTTRGTIYSYRLVAELDINTLSSLQSAPSNEFCIGSELQGGMPIVTNVSVDKTDKTDGQITVKWTRPIDFKKTDFEGPYSYKVYRTDGLGGERYELIKTINTSFLVNNDTVLVDANLDTKNKVYKYKLELYYLGNKLFGTSPSASSVVLGGSPDDKLVKISWQANVPWSNDNNKHKIYRADKNNLGAYNLIAELDVTSPNTYTFVDDGKDLITSDGDISTKLENGVSYCYKVVTVGNYPKLLSLGKLENSSQEFCITPADKTPPCPLVLTIQAPKCENLKTEDFCGSNSFINKLSWTNPANNSGKACRTDIISYKIYFSRYEKSTATLIETKNSSLGTSYDHIKDNLSGYAGCYYVTAISSINVESSPSNKVCVDNCELLRFPNVFSPNGDGKNDEFTPMNCAPFVKSSNYEIFNKSGLLVAAGDGKEFKWDGKSTNGSLLPSGEYYYQINIQFEKLDENSAFKSYKGWVKLIR